MSIQNIEQLSTRIGVATDKLEKAVVNVQLAEGVVVDGSGASAQSAREAAVSATEASVSASQASSSASQAAVSASQANTAKLDASNQIALAKGEVTKATAQATAASSSATDASNQVVLAKAEVTKATTQATSASSSAAAAAQSALEAKNIIPTLPTDLVKEAPRDNQLYGRIDGNWALVPVGGGTGGSGTGSVNTVNGIAPDGTGNVSVPIPQPVAQVRSDWNATSGTAQILNKPVLFNGTYSALTGLPVLFDGNYSNLSNKPALFSGSYNDLTDKPTNTGSSFSGNYDDLINKPLVPKAFSGNYVELTNKPTLFSGDYNDLRNKPVLNDSGETVDGVTEAPEDGEWYSRKDGEWQKVEAGVAFSGDYRDLTNKPPLNADGSVGGGSFNGDYNDLVNKPPLITSNSQLFNGNKYVTDAPYDGGEYYRKNAKWFPANVNEKEYYIPIAAHDYVDLHAVPFYPLRGLFLNEHAHGYYDHPKRRQGYIHYNQRRSPNPFVPQFLKELTYMGHLGFLGDYVVLNGVEMLRHSEQSRQYCLPSGLYSFGLGEWGVGHVLNDSIGLVEVIRVPFGAGLADGSYEFGGYGSDPFLRGNLDSTDYEAAPFTDEKTPNEIPDEEWKDVDYGSAANRKMTPIITIHAINTGEWGIDGNDEQLARGSIDNTYQLDLVTGELILMAGGQHGVLDAPRDHKEYTRLNQQWVEAKIPRKTSELANDAEFVENPPKDGKKYYRTSLGWSEVAYIPPAGAFPVAHKEKLYYKGGLFSVWGEQNPNSAINVSQLEAILTGATYPRAAKGAVFTAEGIDLLPDGKYFFNNGDFVGSDNPLASKSGYIEIVRVPSGTSAAATIEVKAYIVDRASWKPISTYYFDKVTGKWVLPAVAPTTSVVNKRTGTAFEEWIGTQAEYDAVATKDPNTRYWITEA